MGKMMHWELCKKLKFDHANKWYMHNPESILENETQISLGFWDTNGSPNLGQTTKPGESQILDFAIPAEHRVKLKEGEKRDKYLDLTRKLKKLWNMKVTVIPIIIGALDSVTIELVQGLEE